MTPEYSLPPFNPSAPFPTLQRQPAYDFRAQSAREIIAPGVPRCRYPKKDEILQVIPGDAWVSPPLRFSSSRQQFVLLPSTSTVRGQARVLRVAVTALGSIILWPTFTERQAGYQSQQAAIHAAQLGWVRIWKERDEYRHATVTLDQSPSYPTESLAVLAEKAGLRPRETDGAA